MLNIKALLNKILTQITPVNATYGSGTNLIKVRRVGDIVFMASGSLVTTIGGTYNGWFTLAETFRPTEIRYISTVVGSSANIPALVRIETNGNVSVFCASSLSNAGIWLTGSYMI